MISFKNESDKDIVLFSNSFYNKSYKEGGITLQIDELTTPIGGMISEDNRLIIKANDTIKYLFVYAKQYPNKWVEKEILDSNIKKELTDIAKSASLNYLYNEKLNSSKDDCIEGFSIKNKNNVVEFKKELSMDEVMEMVNGKTILIK